MTPYAKLLRSIWTTDFIGLPGHTQRLYMLLFSQADISACGVLPLTIQRWARLAPDTDADSVRADLDALCADRYTIADLSTEELLVRSYIRIDELWKVPNGRRSIDKAAGEVLSSPLRKEVAMLLAIIDSEPYTTVRRTVPRTVGPPQQQATASYNSKLQPATQPSPQPPNGHHRDTTTSVAAAAAVGILVDHKLATDTVRSPGRYRHTLEAELPGEHRQAITAYQTGHPDATPADICEDVLGMDPVAIRQAQRRMGHTS